MNDSCDNETGNLAGMNKTRPIGSRTLRVARQTMELRKSRDVRGIVKGEGATVFFFVVRENHRRDRTLQTNKLVEF